jgi:hypothetical protein
MPKITFTKRLIPDAGRHLVELKDISEVENKFYDPDKQSDKYKTQFQWTWTYDKNSEMEIRSFSTIAPSYYQGKKNRMLEMEEALLGKTLSEKEMAEIDDTNDLIGKKCYITVKHDKDKDSQIHAKIILYEPEKPEEAI